jgi:signal peptidase I
VSIECEVDGISMQPTFNIVEDNHDHVYVNTCDRDFTYGDIVAIDNSRNNAVLPIVKRIVGLPGDIIDFVKDGYEYRLERNGEIIYEDYILIKTDPSIPTSEKNGIHVTEDRFNSTLKKTYPEHFVDGKFVVGENEIFVLGDNRHDSLDSTHFGPFTFDDIIGKVEFVRYYGQSVFDFYCWYILDGKFITTLINIF